jgi:hypothetical protein
MLSDGHKEHDQIKLTAMYATNKSLPTLPALPALPALPVLPHRSQGSSR